MQAKVLAALSGGVDSSVAARLLVEQGHEVVGAYMKNWINEENIAGNCPWQQDIEDARRVADQIGIEFRVVNLMREYRERVVRYLLDGYTGGITPNPDAMCNREMKFGVLREYSAAEGFDFVATGHYAQRRVREPGGTVEVLRGADGSKDQSYFLALLCQEQVRAALFPLGALKKLQVRNLARDWGLATAEKKDSQGICFIGEVRMSDFLRTFLPDDPGPVLDVEGRLLGEHQGLHLFTLGQRRGIGVASRQHGAAYVVVAKEPGRKALVVALEDPAAPLLYASRALVSEVSFLGDGFREGEDLEAQARYRSPSAQARITEWDQDTRRARIEFREAQRALTPGQVCAFYRGAELIGGGFFERIEHES
ncbi:MAG TPA: tRNA 2-thiouridine(34) synthase MnmA [Verrucomicrobiales bacterium]|nr:tRNA 2-thiouridine(34) synthase MnmA [Verrucomicrobiales bacterium]